MGGRRTEEGRASKYQKWDYITLADFKPSSAWNYLSYGWIWFLSIITVAVYFSDTFTAVNLLAFNKWSGAVKPVIPFKISKWIFAVCILLSWTFLGYEVFRAVRVIRRANVAESYLDPLANRLQSLRVTREGQGWRRFLVFSALTKSKKGADYIAIFTYFQFKGCVRVLLAESPRQIVNFITLLSVMQANIVPVGDHAAKDGHSSFDQFWLNIGLLYKAEKMQALILAAMLFTFVVWVFTALCLLVAALLHVGFLWHYIPVDDRSLKRYCRRKVNGRLERIVNIKAKQAIEHGEAKRRKYEEKMGGAAAVTFAPPSRAATLPSVIDDQSNPLDLHRPYSPSLNQSSGPPSVFQPDTGRLPKLPRVPSDDCSNKGSSLSRQPTRSSNFSRASESSNRPLLNQAAAMGSSQGSRREASFDMGSRPRNYRSQTQSSHSSNGSSFSRKPVPVRKDTNGSHHRQDSLVRPTSPYESRAPSPTRRDLVPARRDLPEFQRQNSDFSNGLPAKPRPVTPRGMEGSSYEMRATQRHSPPRQQPVYPTRKDSYAAYNPHRGHIPQRSMTASDTGGPFNHSFPPTRLARADTEPLYEQRIGYAPRSLYPPYRPQQDDRSSTAGTWLGEWRAQR